MKTGVYFLFKKKKIIYIGATTQWPHRLTAHKSIDFDEAKIMECSEKQMFKNEQRLIQIFKPVHNFMHKNPAGPSYRVSDLWVTDNKHVIEQAMLAGSLIEVAHKAKKELGYSPRTGISDVVSSVVRAYERFYNASYDYENRKILTP